MSSNRKRKVAKAHCHQHWPLSLGARQTFLSWKCPAWNGGGQSLRRCPQAMDRPPTLKVSLTTWIGFLPLVQCAPSLRWQGASTLTSSGQPPGRPGRERGVLLSAKQAFQPSPFCLLHYGAVPDAIKYLLSKTQQNGVLCFEKITFDEDSPNYK